jgi:hypothetical protein
MLNSKFIETTRPSKKLDFKRLGPFQIIESLNATSFRLQLPTEMKIHPVFHCSLFEPYNPSKIANRRTPPPQPVIVENSTKYVVKKILATRIRRNRVE